MKEQYFTKDNIFEQSLKIKETVQKFSRHKEFFIKNQNVALLVIDMQNYFLDPDSHAFIPSAKAIIPNIKLLINTCIKFYIPVIFTQHINNEQNAGMMNLWWNDFIAENNPLSKINEEFYIPDSLIINKTQYNSFYKTGLEQELKQLNKTQLIICGVMTNLCCETTVREAYVRGFEPFLPIDATAAYNYDFHLSTIRNLAYGFSTPVLTNEIIEKINLKCSSKKI